jgi:hypothetical protein
MRRETRVIGEDMAGGGEVVNTKKNYAKRKRKKKIVWKKNKSNKLKNEMGYIQSLKEAYSKVRLVISEPNL